jgi:hypothetical protein
MSTPGPCASNDERDTQDTLPEEARWERDKQDMPMRSLETLNPTHPGGALSGHAAAMGCSSWPNHSKELSSSILQPCSTDEEREKEVDRKRG